MFKLNLIVSGKCEEFVDWSCGLRVNGYLSMDECEAKCQPHDHSDDEVEEVINGKSERCNLAPKPGPCKSRLGHLILHDSKLFSLLDICLWLCLVGHSGCDT